MLRVGFARVDITPFLGASLHGYFHPRFAEGVLDPLSASAVVFDDGAQRAVLISIDLLGMNQQFISKLRPLLAEAAGCPEQGVFIHCTHTHLGPGVADSKGRTDNEDYIPFLIHRLQDATAMALRDLAPTEMYYTHSQVTDVAFIRRFRMKDGSVRTNPKRQDPEIDHPIGTPDETAALLILKREGKREIGIINFQVHPDCIGGNLISADYPGFVRKTYEKLIENAYCVYINGAQGDTNHIDVRLPKNDQSHGYCRARYMGERIATAAAQQYPYAQPLKETALSFGQKNILVRHHKGRPEQIEEALRIHKRYQETGSEEGALPEVNGMMRVTLVAEAERIVYMMDQPDTKELCLTALAIGDFALIGFPGEPFTQIARTVKEAAPFTLTMASCCAGGYEGYFPTEDCFEEFSYETATANFAADTATLLTAAATELLRELHQ